MEKGKHSKERPGRGGAGPASELHTPKEDGPHLLTIAGFDNTAGAGLLADIKTFSLFGLYGLGIPTALTVQTPDSLLESSHANADQMRRSLETTLQSFEVLGIKSGLLCDEGIIDTLCNALKPVFKGIFVVDPVLFSSGGRQILSAPGRLTIKEKLFPLADVITPNVDEAKTLAGVQIETKGNMRDCAARLYDFGPRAVLIKGSGRFGGEDFLFDGEKGHFIPKQTELAAALSIPSVHGTGCFHSASLLSLLVLGTGVLEAATKAKYITEKAILTSMPISGFRSRLIDHSAVRPFVREFV